ncbi:MAG: efflux RND transporter permease subunit [Gaiellaceae bacterium]
MRWIVRSSLRFRWLVIFASAAMMFFGVAEVRQAPVDVFPEFAPPRVEIQTPCIGLSAAEVEEYITVPLEQNLAGVAELDVIRSSSVEQLSSITLIFKRGTEWLKARQLVQERLASVAPTLPSWAAPPLMMQPLSSTSRVMKIGLSSERYSLIELSSIVRHTVRQRLLRVPGVANVAIWGQRQVQQQVLVDPERMRAHGVSVQRVMEVAADSLDAVLLKYSPGSMVGTGGFVETPNQRLGIHYEAPILSPRDLAGVGFDAPDGTRLRLGDVADVVIGHPNLVGDAVVNDGKGLLLVVEKFPSANTLEVTRGVEEALESLRPGLTGIEIDSTIFRPATFIEVAIENLTRALLIGCLLLVLVLIAFLFEWRTAFISLVSIPLSLTAAAIVLALRGATINTMVLAGLVIAVGVVVDDAIIDIENIWRRLRQHRSEGGHRPIPRVILEATLEVRSPIVYATLINVIVVVPIFFVEGLSGAFFEPLALSYALAVLASMVVALMVTPALSLILLRRARLERPDSPVVRRLKLVYGGLLAAVIRRPRPVYAAVGVIAAAGLAVTPFLGQSLLPNFKERDFLMHWLTTPGTSLPEETRISVLACRELRSIPGVRNCGSHIGQAGFADEVVNVDFGENWISVDPDADYDETLAAVHEVVDGYPGLFRDVQTYLRERVREVLTGSSHAIVVRIFGPELGVLRRQADRVSRELAGIDGLVDLHVELQEDIPHVEVETNLAAARRHGLKPGDIRRAAATLVQGVEVNDIWQPARVTDVNVWSTPATRNSLTSIRNLVIDKPHGGHVLLADVADVRVAPTPNIIKRENISRRLDVTGDLGGRDLGSVVADVERALARVDFPRGYHAELLGESAERAAAQNRLRWLAAAAAIAVFLLLQVAFGSWRLASLFFVTLPMALVGGVLAVFATGGTISLGALVGFFTVFGIAARNGILLINHYQHLEREEGEPFGVGLVLRGALERLSPILMTALATGLALVPLLLYGDIPGHEIEHPMAVVIVGGLVTSTFVNLFAVPALYLRFGRRRAADTV